MFALYIHWPFCRHKCPYCDFNSHVREGVDAGAYVEALLTEMRYWHAQTGTRALSSIFFGGGTPSLLNPRDVERLVSEAATLWQAEEGMEVTLEANPTSSEGKKFADFAKAGVNRLSLGVQALNDADLKFLGREHSVAEALAALDAARTIFPRFSFDLIYARKNQSVSEWEKELTRALQLAGGHLSLYQLTIEPGTVFAQKTRVGEVFQAPDEDAAAMYELTQDLCAGAGLPAYEVSNHAKLGEECRHNMCYWQYGEYVGIGAGAHGRVRDANDGVRATVTHKPPEMWLRQVREQGHGLASCEQLYSDEQKEEAFMMNLRLTQGINKAAWQARFGTPLEALLDAGALAALAADKYIENTDAVLRTTPKGRLVLTALTGKLLNA